MRLATTVLQVLFALLFCSLLPAADWQVSLDDQVGLNTPAKASFSREFDRLLARHGVQLAEPDFRFESGVTIKLALKAETPPDAISDALGLAHHNSGDIEPHLEVYLLPVMRLMQKPSCWTVVGRALARVAAHEIAHFLLQSSGHAAHGLLRDGFTGAELAADESNPALWHITSRLAGPAAGRR